MAFVEAAWCIKGGFDELNHRMLYVSNIHTWKASPENPKEKPKLEFADPLFKRRLSQITRMTIQVVHDLLEKVPEAKDYKQVFVSFRGEVEREFIINQGIIEESEILPAGFSLSVFNTPIAAASLSLGLKSGYSVIYPSRNNFFEGLAGAAAPVLAGSEEKVIFVYADEYVPDCYGEHQPENNEAFAFACVLSSQKKQDSVEIKDIANFALSPLEFIEKVAING